jgi:predicted extracellular nuclease
MAFWCCSISSTRCITASLSCLAVLVGLSAHEAHGRRHSPAQPPSAPDTRPQPTQGRATPDNSDTRASLKNCSPDSTVTLATYNVENFWDNIESNSRENNYDEYKKGGSNWYSEQMYQKKAENLADALIMSGTPDIVAMQEIESAGNASKVLDILKSTTEKLGYKFYALGLQSPNNPVSVTTAVISKFPITSNANLDFNVRSQDSDETISMSNSSARDPQVVNIDVNGSPLRLYVAHLKSRRGDYASGDAMRFAAAELMRRDIEQQRSKNPSLDIMVTGDFNSDETERPLLEGLLSSSDKNSLKRDSNHDHMYNMWFELPKAERCSYMHGGQLWCLDHILGSANLFDGRGLDLVEGSFQVVGHNGGEAAERLVKDDGRTPYRWGLQRSRNGSRFTGTGYSDHLPLVVTLKQTARCQ